MSATVMTVPYQCIFNHINYGCDFLASGPILLLTAELVNHNSENLGREFNSVH